MSIDNWLTIRKIDHVEQAAEPGVYLVPSGAVVEFTGNTFTHIGYLHARHAIPQPRPGEQDAG